MEMKLYKLVTVCVYTGTRVENICLENLKMTKITAVIMETAGSVLCARFFHAGPSAFAYLFGLEVKALAGPNPLEALKTAIKIAINVEVREGLRWKKRTWIKTESGWHQQHLGYIELDTDEAVREMVTYCREYYCPTKETLGYTVEMFVRDASTVTSSD